MSSTVTQTISAAQKYRGAVVEDLQMPPAFTLPDNEVISRAIEQAYERDFSHIPVLDSHRKPLGYIDVLKMKSNYEAGKADPNDSVTKHMTRFKRSASQPYSVITPDSDLADLEEFLQNNVFALDYDRKFVLGVVTLHDLENFVSRRGC